MPLYAECEADVKNKHLEWQASVSAKQGMLSTELVYFDQLSSAHPSLIGYVEIMGEVPKDAFVSLEMYANTIRRLCFPEGVIVIEDSPEAPTIFRRHIAGNVARGINANYVVFDEKEWRIYFNNPQKELQ
jgi:hypothetical protein